MSGSAPQVEWYIARDGAQHGPISDVEMRKFVELGHLRSTDLVWCARFTEWQSGAQAFPEHMGPKPAATTTTATTNASAAPSAGPRGSAAQAANTARQPIAVSAAPAATATNPAPGVQSRFQAATQQPRDSGNARAGSASAPESSDGRNAADDAAWAAAMRAVMEADMRAGASGPAAGSANAQPVAAPTPAAATARADPAFTARAAAPNPSAVHTPASHTHATAAPGSSMTAAVAPDVDQRSGPMSPAFAARPLPQVSTPRLTPQLQPSYATAEAAPGTDLQDLGHDDYPDEEPEARRGWLGKLAAVAAALLILGGLGWIGWQNRSMFSGATAIGDILVAKISSAPSPDLFRAPPYEAPGETKDLIDLSLQKTAVWRLLKRDFADWYGERLGDVERMRGQRQDEKIVSKFLADVIVTLRRRNAQTALLSSPEHLRQMAGSFVANLKQLASRDGQTCFQFITFGEASPFMLELSRTPAFAETLQKQLVAVLEAIVEGRTNRHIHPATRRADYDQLTKDLTARGWTQNDLATFSDPQKLSSSPPDKVCTLVQEWFVAQLALKDPELQARLLAESLKPLVGG